MVVVVVAVQNTRIINRMANSLGYACDVASGGVPAIERVLDRRTRPGATPYCLILMDINACMDEWMDGPALLYPALPCSALLRSVVTAHVPSLLALRCVVLCCVVLRCVVLCCAVQMPRMSGIDCTRALRALGVRTHRQLTLGRARRRRGLRHE